MIPSEYAKYEKVVSVACINYSSIWGNKKANLQKMTRVVADAADLGNNIIVFPELALSGYSCPENCTMHKETAETIPGTSTVEMAQVAARHNVYIVFGMPEQDKANPALRYITSAIVGPEGIIGAYRKVHVAGPPRYREVFCFASGSQVPVFETRYGPIGIQICADFWIAPELSRILALKGARLIVNTTASPVGANKPYFLVQQTGARASENHVFTASANMAGKEPHAAFYGHSCIAGPAYPKAIEIFARSGEAEEIVSATLNFERLHRSWEMGTMRQMLHTDLIVEEYAKIAQNRAKKEQHA